MIGQSEAPKQPDRTMSVGDAISATASVVTILAAIPVVWAVGPGGWKSIGLYLGVLFLVTILFLWRSNRGPLGRFLMFRMHRRFPYIVIRKETLYHFHSRERLSHQKTARILSRIEGLHEYSTRFGWSGEGHLKPQPAFPKQHIAHAWEADRMSYFTILFDRHYNKGEIIDTGFKILEFEDPDHKSLLYLSTGIFEPIKLIALVLKCDGPLIPKKIIVKRFRKHFDLSPEWVGSIAFDVDQGEARYELAYPRIGSKLSLEWEFDSV